MSRAEWMTPEEVLLILGGWCTVALLLAVGWARMHRSKRRHQQYLRDIADLQKARRDRGLT